VLALQLVQVVATEAPTFEEYLPASHATQELSAVAPVLMKYLPAAQSTNIEAGPVYPLSQRQAVIFVCPVSACPEFDGQTAHIDDNCAVVVGEIVAADSFLQVSSSLEGHVESELLLISKCET
jgi:hypothetical protein